MLSLLKGKKLPRNFYKKDVVTVARRLLGKVIVRAEVGQVYAGKIVEVEAYDGETDEAAHTYKGITERNRIMFGEGGFLYVYFTYGAHFCANIVTGEKGKGTAVLLRGIEPICGIEKMKLNRFGISAVGKKDTQLTNGPGKICSAFKIDKKLYGQDLTGNTVYILDAPEVTDKEIVVSKRIGIKKSVNLPWRFYIKDNPFVSKK